MGLDHPEWVCLKMGGRFFFGFPSFIVQSKPKRSRPNSIPRLCPLGNLKPPSLLICFLNSNWHSIWASRETPPIRAFFSFGSILDVSSIEQLISQTLNGKGGPRGRRADILGCRKVKPFQQISAIAVPALAISLALKRMALPNCLTPEKGVGTVINAKPATMFACVMICANIVPSNGVTPMNESYGTLECTQCLSSFLE